MILCKSINNPERLFLGVRLFTNLYFDAFTLLHFAKQCMLLVVRRKWLSSFYIWLGTLLLTFVLNSLRYWEPDVA